MKTKEKASNRIESQTFGIFIQKSSRTHKQHTHTNAPHQIKHRAQYIICNCQPQKKKKIK